MSKLICAFALAAAFTTGIVTHQPDTNGQLTFSVDTDKIVEVASGVASAVSSQVSKYIKTTLNETDRAALITPTRQAPQRPKV